MNKQLLTAASIALLAAEVPTAAPEQAVQDFLTSYQSIRVSGLPGAAASRKLGAFLSAGLQAAMTKARAEQARCVKAHPDDKGPWIEGDMFSSNFEGFSTFRVGPADGARITVKFEYEGIPSWTDQVELVKQGNRWLIDDVLYGRKQGFSNGFGGSLRAALRGKGCQ